MTAFLLIPKTDAAGRRLDFAAYAGLFSEAEEPLATPPSGHRRWDRLAAALLCALFAVGDLVVLAKPVAGMAATARHAAPTL